MLIFQFLLLRWLLKIIVWTRFLWQVARLDIQSLADLNNSFEIIPAMLLFPFSKNTVLQITATVLLPVLPLTLTLISLEELAQKIIGILL